MTTTIPPTRTRMSPRRRSRLVRAGLYAVLALGLAAALLVADWPRIQRNFFNTETIAEMLPAVITIAAKNTVIYTVAAFSIGIVLALLLALMKLSSIGPYRWMATIYIELFRGLPALITIILVAFGLPIAFGWRIPGGTLGTGSIGLAIVAAAYMAETIRAGVQAVPRGQMEAARSLGMSQPRAMISIVLPQAFRIIVPPLTNEFVLLIKDTSLLFVIGTTPITRELTKFARDNMTTARNATPLTVAAVAYLAITLPLTRLVAQLEKRNARAR
jgi:polar amino acid transport system permease protein